MIKGLLLILTTQQMDPHDIHSFKGMDSSDLSEIAKTVCEKLDQYKVAVYTDPGSSKEGPGFIVLRLKCGDGIDEKSIQKRRDALKLALELDQNQELNIYTDRGFVVLEIPKKMNLDIS